MKKDKSITEIQNQIKEINEKLFYNTRFFVKHGDNLTDSEFENLNNQRIQLESQKDKLKKEIIRIEQENRSKEKEISFNKTAYFYKFGDKMVMEERNRF